MSLDLRQFPQARPAMQRRRDKRGVDLIPDALSFRRVWYGKPTAVSNAVGHAKFRSCSHDTLIRVKRTCQKGLAGGVLVTLRASVWHWHPASL